MKIPRFPLVCCALAALLCAAEPAMAAWNNVFQVTCLFRNRRTTSNFYQAPVVVQSSPVVAAPNVSYSNPCNTCQPQTSCSTSYVQRSYYEPVTTYQTKTYYEPVTTYRTSYYYEPVTSYSYSCYYDPCSCSYKQVAVPSTSYQLKAQQCPVQSWVQRCTQEPVTSYRKSYYWEPRTTCCTTTSGAAIPAQQPTTSQPPIGNPPNVTENRSNSIQPPKVTEDSSTQSQQYNRYYPPANNGNTEPPRNYSPELPNPPTSNQQRSQQQPAPQVRLDRIASFTRPENSLVQGQIVRNDNAPRANTKLVFINADRHTNQQFVTANSTGRFDVALPTGRWLVYIDNQNGVREYHSRIDVPERDRSFVRLVSR